jgi:phage shock protein PspC (stress-responsive transcriptional regulator)
MRKVVIVHLNSKVFQMEEEAYLYLQRTLEAQWQRGELETRVGERLAQNSAGGENVVTLPEVIEVLRQLGISSPTGHFTGGAPKKLYRRVTNKVIAGVCSGLGEYFAVDPVAVRSFFLISFFLGSLGFWLYVVLWIAIPPFPERP